MAKTNGLNEKYLMSSTCENMSDGTEMDYVYRKVTLMKDIQSDKQRQLDLVKKFLRPVHNQTV